MKESESDISQLKAKLGVEIGSGMTMRIMLRPETKEDRAEIERVLGKSTMQERIDRIESEAWETLHDSGKFKEAAKAKLANLERKPDFEDPAWPQDWPGGSSILCFAIKKLGFNPYEDDEWYAARIVSYARCLRAALYNSKSKERSDHFYAALSDGQTRERESLVGSTMSLIELRTEWHMKKKWEKRAMRHEAGGNSTKRKSQPAQTEAIRVATEIWAEAGPVQRIGGVVSKIQDVLVDQGFNYKPEAIKRWLKTASKDGSLIIPEDASRAGANKQRNRS